MLIGLLLSGGAACQKLRERSTALDGRARIANATVKASMDKQILIATTDYNGDFALKTWTQGPG